MDDPRITTEANEPPAPRRADYYDDPDRDRPTDRRADYKKDREHLNLLSIFYFVFCGLECFGLLILPLEGVFIVGIFSSAPAGPNAPPPELGYFLAAVLGFASVLTLAAAICLGLTGHYLRKRKRRMFCFVIACIICMSVPLGTLLGVFTILVLMRESVKDLFQYGDNPPADGDREGGPYGG